MRRTGRLLFLVWLIFLSGSCRYSETPQSDPADRDKAVGQADSDLPVVTGEMVAVASWYGHPYHGRRTSNGEIYDMDLLTAAHRTWPFHTLVRVTHLGNGRSVLVRINDRGPFVEGREIDLSREAASRLNMIEEGTARVRLEILADQKGPVPPGTTMPPTVGVGVETPPDLSRSPSTNRYRLQLGAFSSEKNALRLLDRLQQTVDIARFQVVSGSDYFRVLSKDCHDEAEAERLRHRLVGLGFSVVLRSCD